jgi:hypothetical protein
MFAACWSAKGGSGTTVVSAALGLVLARHTGGALLVDLSANAPADLPAVLGLAEPAGPGVSDWLEAGADVPVDAWSRLEVAISDHLHLLPRGSGRLEPLARVEVLAGALSSQDRSVVVDCGVPRWADGEPADAGAVLATLAPASVLVTRGCYLALRRLVASPVRPSGVVLLSEQGRALGRSDVEAVVEAPVIAEVPIDAGIARAVDAGLLAARLPRSLERALSRAR